MSAARVDAYARAILEIVRAEGQEAEVEDELFRFARAVDGDDALRTALSDPGLPPERRSALVEDLLGPALRVTKAVASLLVAAGRGAELSAVVDRFLALVAEGRRHVVAEVRSAVALDDATRSRLADALGAATGRDVEVRVVVDDSVLGGIVARIGDTVIDGSVRHRLEQLKEQI